MDYQRHYALLMDRAGRRVLFGYSEKHHIVPKCLDKTSKTIVRLTPEEHFVAHQMLVRMHPHNQRLAWALVCMTNPTKNQVGRQNKLYGWMRRRFAEMVRQYHTGRKRSAAQRAVLSAAHLGKSNGPHSVATKAKMSAASKGRPKSAAHRASMSATRIGRGKGVRHDEQWRANQSRGVRAAIANGCYRGDTSSPEHHARLSAAMKDIWVRRRAGELPPRKPRNRPRSSPSGDLPLSPEE